MTNLEDKSPSITIGEMPVTWSSFGTSSGVSPSLFWQEYAQERFGAGTRRELTIAEGFWAKKSGINSVNSS